VREGARWCWPAEGGQCQRRQPCSGLICSGRRDGSHSYICTRTDKQCAYIRKHIQTHMYGAATRQQLMSRPRTFSDRLVMHVRHSSQAMINVGTTSLSAPPSPPLAAGPLLAKGAEALALSARLLQVRRLFQPTGLSACLPPPLLHSLQGRLAKQSRSPFSLCKTLPHSLRGRLVKRSQSPFSLCKATAEDAERPQVGLGRCQRANSTKMCKKLGAFCEHVVKGSTNPPEKLLGDGFSTPMPLFCLICTSISNKTCILD